MNSHNMISFTVNLKLVLLKRRQRIHFFFKPLETKLNFMSLYYTEIIKLVGHVDLFIVDYNYKLCH